MDRGPTTAFAVRLRDLLATVESTAVISAAGARLRGLGEQLQFACLALPCSEALVALEIAQLGRLRVPGVASAEAWRATDHDFLPTGTPFAYLLGGGGGYAAQLEPDDAMLEALRPVLQTTPRHAMFVPLRIGSGVVGGAALFRDEESMSDAELTMCERLAEVLALTLESFRTERILLELFARMLPDLCGPDAPTRFLAGLEKYVHQLRVAPEYQRRLELAEVIGKIAAHGSAEAAMATDVLARVERYVAELVGSEAADDGLEPFADDELYG